MRVWLVFNVLFVALVVSSWYSSYRLAAADNQRLVESQALTLTKSRFEDIKGRRFRDFVEGVGREFSDLYVRLRIADETFEFGRPPAPGHCADLAHPLGKASTAGDARITMCRPFRFSTAPMMAVLLVYVLISGLSLAFVRRLERRTTTTLIEFLKGSGVEIDSHRDLIGIMADMRDIRLRLDRAQAQERQLIDTRVRAELAEQVAHDIRSPLAALHAAAGDAAALPAAKRRQFRDALERIREIADGLLARRRPDRTRAAMPPVSALSDMIEQIVSEKSLGAGTSGESRILFECAAPGELSARVDPAEFKRVLSNLINNALESGAPDSAPVRIEAARDPDEVRVTVRDGGKGMPPEVVARAGERGFSHGKAAGSGLGLHHARESVEVWGGRLEIDSKVGVGTAVTLVLPAVGTTAQGIRRLDAVLIDDDPLTRLTWRNAAHEHGKDFVAFETLAAFHAACATLDKRTPVYLDVDLGGGASGLEESARLHAAGFQNLYLATGRPAGSFSGHEHLSGVVGKEPPWGA
ncbi:MAG: HAMP domain-containing sensor histidine kinase [Elusimicrobiota bacterium]|nr:HAMP domain-containing sensor histidine kinase [Elusimicrobiota bacterium]